MFRSRVLVPIAVVALGIVATAHILSRLRSDARAQAVGREPRVVTYVVQLLPGSATTALGTVPAGRRLILKDFMGRPNRTDVLRVFADGVLVAVIPAVDSGSTVDAHLSAGIAIEGGQEVGLADASGAEYTIAGVLE